MHPKDGLIEVCWGQHSSQVFVLVLDGHSSKAGGGKHFSVLKGIECPP